MRSITKLILIGVFSILCCTQIASATIVASDSFNYGDGTLVGAPGSMWEYREGTRNQINITNGKVILTSSETEDAKLGFIGAPYTTGFLTATFEVTFSQLPTSIGAPILGFESSSSSSANGRVMTAPGVTQNTFRIGVSNNRVTGSGGQYVPMDLSLGVTYVIALTVDLAKDISSVSVDGGAPVLATDTSVDLAVTELRLRQATNMGTMAIDNLQVSYSLVPEPGTWLLLAPGFLWLSAVRHRRKVRV